MSAAQSMTPTDASEALHLIEQAQGRSAQLRGYQSFAPHLIMWGCVYAAAYTFSYFKPAHSGLAWLLLVPLATAGDIAIAVHDRSGQTCERTNNRALLPGLVATFLAFIIATAAIMQPQDPKQMAAFVPLAVAACYIALGLGIGQRLTYTGIALGVLTVFGFFALPALFMLWMAAVGGGALILGGLWLRRI